MPIPRLPSECLTNVLSTVKHTSDLLACSLVCWEWYDAALPFLLNLQSLRRHLQIKQYSNQELDGLGDIAITSRRHGLALGQAIKLVEVDYFNILRCSERASTLDPVRVKLVAHVLRELIPEVHSVSLSLNRSTNPKRMQLVKQLIPQIVPDIQNIKVLVVSELKFDKSQDNERPTFIRKILGNSVHGILSLIDSLHPQLEQIHLYSSDFNLALSLALRNCRHIHTFRIRWGFMDLPPDHFAQTIASWPNLHTLDLGTCSAHQRFADLAFAALALNPPQNLAVLRLGGSIVVHDWDPVLRLMTAYAPTLVELELPRFESVSSDRLLAFLSVPMPRLLRCDLRSLDLSSIAGELGSVPSLAWPRLREITLPSLNLTFPIAFVNVLRERCPELERINGFLEITAEIKKVLEAEGFMEKPYQHEWVKIGAVLEEENRWWCPKEGLSVRITDEV